MKSGAGNGWNNDNQSRTATVVVAASNSSAKSKQGADYICDGIDDHLTIQAALNSLPVGGGKCVLTEGNFYLGATGVTYDCITIPSNVHLQGTGKYNTLLQIGNNVPLNPIGALSVSGIAITDLGIDGNKSNNASTGAGADRVSNGIYFNTVTNSRIENCYVHDVGYHGIFLFNNSSNNRIIRNHSANNGFRAMHSHGGCNYNIYKENYCIRNGAGFSGETTPYGGLFVIYGGNSYNIVTNNIIQDDNVYGIHISGPQAGEASTYGNGIGNVVTANTINCSINSPNVHGIYISVGATLQNTVISNNRIYATGHGIVLNDGITNNMIISNNDVKGVRKALLVIPGGNYLTITGNNLYSTAEEAAQITSMAVSSIANNNFKAHSTFDTMKLTGVTNSIIKDNTMVNCNYAINEISGCTGNIIKDNIGKTVTTSPYFVIGADDTNRASGNVNY